MVRNRPSLVTLAKGIIALPFMVLVVIPSFLLFLFSYNLVLNSEIHMFFIAIGIVPTLIGLFFAVDTVKTFFAVGKGTPAPWEPPQKLVITGLYSRMRNPMITGVVFILLGESLIFNSAALLVWAVFFFVLNHFYFIFSEEPALEKRFGKDYIKYKKEVPRWIPKLK
ncbi:MAG: isoprenylcysteine carboxylmethyltransferase family protein [Candidatus Aenigmarchaeota archaeon]|nr:isoprenylcysteine carboxylmethyltransferase family protein [Candidatus Aenigmarchaeota archaeon]